MAEPIPCTDHPRCNRPRIWRVTSPADFFHTVPIDTTQTHCSSHTCDQHLKETVRWARAFAGEPEVVALRPRKETAA